MFFGQVVVTFYDTHFLWVYNILNQSNIGNNSIEKTKQKELKHESLFFFTSQRLPSLFNLSTLRNVRQIARPSPVSGSIPRDMRGNRQLVGIRPLDVLSFNQSRSIISTIFSKNCLTLCYYCLISWLIDDGD